MPDAEPRAIVIGMKTTGWIVEHRKEISSMAVDGWMPVVKGREVIDAMKRTHGAENVLEWSE